METKIIVDGKPLDEVLKTLNDEKFKNIFNVVQANNNDRLKDFESLRSDFNILTDRINKMEIHFINTVTKLQSTQLEDHKSFWASFKDTFSGSKKRKVKQTTVDLNE